MNLDELKNLIEQGTGVPAAALAGNTASALIDNARALLAYKIAHEHSAPKSNADLFTAWLDSYSGTKAAQDPRITALDDLQEQARVEAGGYPRVKDAGELDDLHKLDATTNTEKFKEWFADKLATDPRQGPGGWIRII